MFVGFAGVMKGCDLERVVHKQSLKMPSDALYARRRRKRSPRLLLSRMMPLLESITKGNSPGCFRFCLK